MTMKKYIDPERPRYVYYIRETLNGFGIQVLNVERDDRFPLTLSIAHQIGLIVPEGFQCHCGEGQKADLEAHLDSFAKANDLIEIE